MHMYMYITLLGRRVVKSTNTSRAAQHVGIKVPCSAKQLAYSHTINSNQKFLQTQSHTPARSSRSQLHLKGSKPCVAKRHRKFDLLRSSGTRASFD